jgi:methyl coenzyme M reductase gamma subunit
MHVLESDINGVMMLSGQMARQIIEIGEKNNIKITPFKMIFGAGATDAAESARIGITSTTIFGLPTSVMRDGMVYHPARDTVDTIEPGS